jgi:hypothetical protein
MEYEYLWRNKFLATGTKSFNEFIAALENAVKQLKAMKKDGVQFHVDGVADDYARFTTNDSKIAKKYGFEKVEIEA